MNKLACRYCFAIILLMSFFLPGFVRAQITCTIDNTVTYSTSPALANGSSYKNFADAVTRLNAFTVTSPITFNITAGQTFNEPSLINIGKSGTAANPIKFQKFGSGANPIIVPAAGNSNGDAIVRLSAVNYLTIDGLDVQENPANAVGNQAMEYGFFLLNSVASNGSNNTIRNCNITLNKANTNATYGIYQNSFGAGFTCSFNTYENISVSNTFYGIYLLGKTGLNDDGCTVRNCTIGAAATGDIGNNSAITTLVAGVYGRFQSNTTINNCEVRNLTATSVNTSSEVSGIYLLNATGTLNIFNNKIHDLYNRGTGASTANCSGINITLAGPADVANIYNNFISGIYNGDNIAVPGSTGAVRVCGILIAGSSSGTANVQFNSVYLQNSSTNYISTTACLLSTTTVANTLNVANNIFKNSYVASGIATTFCVYISSALTTLGTFNYNNYDIVPSATVKTGRLITTAAQSLADWQSLAGKDANSKQFITNFANIAAGTEDLHLSITAIDHNYDATPISSILNDIDGEVRSTLIPFIGADERAGVSLPVSFASIKVYQKSSKIVQVEWAIADEVNVENYVVEKATGSTFKTIATVMAAGLNKYSTQDILPITGSNFYRIKSVDKDGKIKYSNTVSVTIKEGNPVVAIYPNPSFNGYITIEMKREIVQPINFFISDVNGRKLMNGIIKSNVQLIELKALQAGSYILKIENEPGILIIKKQ